MTPLAEISDKMWSISTAVVIALVVASLATWPGLIKSWLTLPSVGICALGNVALASEFRAPGMWEAIVNELGWRWVFGNLVAWNAGFLVAWTGVFLNQRYGIRAARQTAGYCQHCGYNLTGNVTGVCPECGAGIRKDAAESLRADQ
jgi:hypothetical protein